MKKKNTTTKLLMILFILKIMVLSSCVGQQSISPSKRYARETKEYSFEWAMKNNESFTLKSLEEDLKALKEEDKESKEQSRTSKKIAKVKAEIEELKARKN